MKRVRVLLADDHALLLEAFTRLLEPEFDVVATVTDGRALIETAIKTKPDVVVLDVSMPLLNGLDAGQQLKRRLPDLKVIFLTVNEDPDIVTEAFRIGASGYLVKGSAASELFQAIKEVTQGRAYVTPLVTKDMLESFVGAPHRRRRCSKLTPRQREVLQLLAEGHSMKEVAGILNVSTRTVAFHKYRMMEELGIRTSAELIQLAVREGIVPQ